MSRTKRLLAVLLALCGALLCGCGQRETETEELPVLVIGSDNYEPYFYLDENGAYAGIDVEIAKAACERLGWTPDFRQISWQEKDQLLADRDVDCLWGSFSMNGREDRYRWAGPYMYSRQVVIVQASSDIYGLGDLNGKRIAVQTSSKPEELFLKHQVPGVEQVDSVYCFADTVDVFAALDIDFDGTVFETYFRAALYDSAIPVPGAMELLEALHGKYPLAVASNGPYDQQLHRLELAGMKRYFDWFFVSERLGASKPARAFFDGAFAALNDGCEAAIAPKDCVIIGDSLTSDMAGGRQYGMKTCYYRRPGAAEGTDVTWQVTDLRQIPALLEGTAL